MVQMVDEDDDNICPVVKPVQTRRTHTMARVYLNRALPAEGSKQ